LRRVSFRRRRAYEWPVTRDRDPGVRSVLGLGTAQRNVAAAILITGLNIFSTMTLLFVLA
jgi:hypothetical protein